MSRRIWNAHQWVKFERWTRTTKRGREYHARMIATAIEQDKIARGEILYPATDNQ